MESAARIVWIIVLLTLAGVVGFRLIEGWSLVDCAFMTVITLTTVGYGEVEPLSQAGKIFVIVYLCLGLGAFLFCIAEVGKLMVQGVFREWMETRRMENVKSSLEDHFIVCGFGRMGQIVCEQLAKTRVPFVVMDHDESVVSTCRDRKWPLILGDCTEDRMLESAGITKARGLVATLGSDADNLYVVISARQLSGEGRRLLIVARCADDAGAAKLRRAGADQVVNLYSSSASRMARWLVNPHVQEFIELVTTDEAELDLAEIEITEDSPYAGRSLAETDLRSRGVIVVAIKSADGKLLPTPGADVRIRVGDSLMALGSGEAIEELCLPA